MNEGLWIPIVMFVGLTVVFSLFFMFRYRARSDMQQTIRTAIDKGQDLSPEIIDRLGKPRSPKDQDLRVAMIWMAIALGLGVFGFMVPEHEDEVRQVFTGIAAFPFFISVAYIIMWRFAEKRS